MKKPDNVADNPGLLPYGSNVGAPSIKVDNIQSWKEPRIKNINKHFENKFNQLKSEYEKLIEEYTWNDLIYNAQFNFEPIIGHTYHLYISNKGQRFLSIIEPNFWNQDYIGSFSYDHDNKWIKIN